MLNRNKKQIHPLFFTIKFLFLTNIVIFILQNSEKISHKGVISEIRDEAVFVNIMQASACAGCHVNSACSMADKKEKVVEVFDISGKFKEGEEVMVACSSAMGLKAVFYAFVVPLFLVLVTLMSLIHVIQSEVLAIIGSISLLSLYFVVLYVLKNRFKKKFTFTLSKCNVEG